MFFFIFTAPQKTPANRNSLLSGVLRSPAPTGSTFRPRRSTLFTLLINSARLGARNLISLVSDFSETERTQKKVTLSAVLFSPLLLMDFLRCTNWPSAVVLGGHGTLVYTSSQRTLHITPPSLPERSVTATATAAAIPVRQLRVVAFHQSSSTSETGRTWTAAGTQHRTHGLSLVFSHWLACLAPQTSESRNLPNGGRRAHDTQLRSLLPPIEREARCSAEPCPCSTCCVLLNDSRVPS